MRLLRSSRLPISKSTHRTPITNNRHSATARPQTSPPKNPHPPRTLPSTIPLTLTHFLQRQRVLALYRAIRRATARIPSASTQKELRALAREEFERNRAVTDLGQVRYLVSTGRAEMERWERYVVGL